MGLGGEHLRHIYEGEPDEDLVEALEPDQLVVEMDRPVAPARLGRGQRIGLWALRIFVLTMAAMVLFVFVSQLRGPGA